MTALATLDVNVHTIKEAEAELLGNLSTPQTVQIMLRSCNRTRPYALRALSSGCARITMLSLWNMPDYKLRCDSFEDGYFWKHLLSMQQITSLVITRPQQFTGTMFQKQPNLSTLYLIDCDGVSEAGVEHIVRMCPNLSSVLFCSEFKLDMREAQQALVTRCLSKLCSSEKATSPLIKLATVVSNSCTFCRSGLRVYTAQPEASAVDSPRSVCRPPLRKLICLAATETASVMQQLLADGRPAD